MEKQELDLDLDNAFRDPALLARVAADKAFKRTTSMSLRVAVDAIVEKLRSLYVFPAVQYVLWKLALGTPTERCDNEELTGLCDALSGLDNPLRSPWNGQTLLLARLAAEKFIMPLSWTGETRPSVVLLSIACGKGAAKDGTLACFGSQDIELLTAFAEHGITGERVASVAAMPVSAGLAWIRGDFPQSACAVFFPYTKKIVQELAAPRIVCTSANAQRVVQRRFLSLDTREHPNDANLWTSVGLGPTYSALVMGLRHPFSLREASNKAQDNEYEANLAERDVAVKQLIAAIRPERPRVDAFAQMMGKISNKRARDVSDALCTQLSLFDGMLVLARFPAFDGELMALMNNGTAHIASCTSTSLPKVKTRDMKDVCVSEIDPLKSNRSDIVSWIIKASARWRERKKTVIVCPTGQRACGLLAAMFHIVMFRWLATDGAVRWLASARREIGLDNAKMFEADIMRLAHFAEHVELTLGPARAAPSNLVMPVAFVVVGKIAGERRCVLNAVNETAAYLGMQKLCSSLGLDDARVLRVVEVDATETTILRDAIPPFLP